VLADGSTDVDKDLDAASTEPRVDTVDTEPRVLLVDTEPQVVVVSVPRVQVDNERRDDTAASSLCRQFNTHRHDTR